MTFRAAAALGFALVAAPALAEPAPKCRDGACRVQLTPPQLLAMAERLVRERRHAEVRPLLAALRMAPGYAVHSRFLSGLVDREAGDLKSAADHFQSILADDPGQTRVRLELAQTFLQMKRPASADRQFRIAAQDEELPPEVARIIRGARDTIRSQRAWRLDAAYGFAPDSNINNATAADTVTVQFGATQVPLTLNQEAKARSGTGRTGNVSAGLRLPVGSGVSALAELDAFGTDHDGVAFDDYLVQAAAGAEYGLTNSISVSLQAVGAQRWFGGQVASRQFGARLGGQAVLGGEDRVGLQLDMRRTDAMFDRAFGGWSGSLHATYERAVSRTVVASVGPYVRREWLREAAFSSTEVGAVVGVGGELPRGFNMGASLGVSRALFDAPLYFFDAKPRDDARAVFRATLGNRKLRFLGLSPQLNWTYAKTDSSLALFAVEKSRFDFTLARYF